MLNSGMMRSILWWCLLVIHVACGRVAVQDQNLLRAETAKVYVVDEANINSKKERLYSEIFEYVKYVPLETNSQSAISDIRAVFVIDEFFYVRARGRDQILVFDEVGNYQRVLGKRGKGPGEYSSIQYIHYDDMAKKVYAMDPILKKILIYSLQGILLDEIKLNFTERIGDSFILLKNEGFLFPLKSTINTRGDGYILTDLQGHVKLRLLQGQGIAYEFTHVLGSREVNDFGFGVTLVPRYSNIVYRFQNNQLYEYVKMIPKTGYDPDGVEKIYQMKSGMVQSLNFTEPVSPYKGMWSLNNYLETGVFISFMFIHGAQGFPVSIFLNKRTSDISTGFWVDDMTLDFVHQQFSGVQLPYLIKWGPRSTPYHMDWDQRELIDHFKQHLSPRKEWQRFSTDSKLKFQQFNANSNPVIMLYKIKDEYL